VHYDDEPGRREAFRDAVADGMPGGYGAGDAAALHFVGTELERVVSSRPRARAFEVSAGAGGNARERKLPVSYLGGVADTKALAA
jgi:hypothetical protein